MSDPAETPAQAIERLNREIRALKDLRAKMPMLILEPHVAEASKHIGEVAARLTVTPKVPASEAIATSREAAQAETRPAAGPSVPITLPGAGTRVTWAPEGLGSIVIGAIPITLGSPAEAWEILILTEDGRLLTVKPEELTLIGAIAPTPGPTPKLGPGTRVRVKPSGKTGYVSEVADANALVALDEGGFLTVPITDLEALPP